ncbi:hypothetical protein N0V94_003207 [Neodidymelliopsis sp. IMI 364377]|nr:hypothetical protein N0V94_003207 [Neodidymelliopsis sp. IMI 364377]
MESRQANVRPTRSVQKPDQFDVDTAQPSIKEEDVGDDGDSLTYRSRPQLPQAYKCMRNLAHLMSKQPLSSSCDSKLTMAEHMEDGTIDVDPEYQREVVWTVLAFVKGMIPCHDHRGEKWWFIEPAGNKKKRVLPEQVRNQFLRKEFISFEYTNLSPEQEEDLFARVQMGMQLNLAEKMRASTGPWQELARLFVEDFPAIYSLMKDRARSKDFQITLSCFSQIVECMHPTNPNGLPVLKTNHTHLPKLLSNKGAVDDNLKSHLASVWNTFKTMIEINPNVFTNANKYLRGVQTFAPVEMVAVAVLISTHSETRNNSLLLGDIKAMREAVREDFVDLRLNATVWKWFWDYIDNLESIRGAIDGSTVDRQFNQRTRRPAVGATAGSTASSIVSAAAAPRRGRATARTKRPAIMIPEDLTGDVEQERQSLLSAFKTDPTRNVSSQSATTPVTQTRLSIAGEQEQSSRRRLTKENNPYARFKNK